MDVCLSATFAICCAARTPRCAARSSLRRGSAPHTHEALQRLACTTACARAHMLVSPASTGVPVLMACAAACCRHPCLCPQPLVPPHFPVAGRDPRLHQCHLGRRRPHRCRRPRQRHHRRRPYGALGGDRRLWSEPAASAPPARHRAGREAGRGRGRRGPVHPPLRPWANLFDALWGLHVRGSQWA